MKKNIIFYKGSVFECQELNNVDMIVNTVNIQGIMGKGLALEFKLRFPKMFINYKNKCNENSLKIGELHFYKSYNAYIKEALNFFKENKLSKSKKIFNMAIEINLNDLTIYPNKDQISKKLKKQIFIAKNGNLNEAIESFNKIIKKNTKNDKNIALILKGITLIKMNKEKKAIKCFEEVIKQNPKNYNAYNNKGIALIKMNKEEKAIKCFEEVIKQNPKNYNAYNNKGVALIRLNKEEKAIKCFEEVIKQNQKNYNAYINKGFALIKLNKEKEADECFTKIPSKWKKMKDIRIINFPTKKFWIEKSKKEYIEESLNYFVNNYSKYNIKSIAFPKLGTNNGGLEWKAIKKIMKSKLSNLNDIQIYICLDEEEPKEKSKEYSMINHINSMINHVKKNAHIEKENFLENVFAEKRLGKKIFKLIKKSKMIKIKRFYELKKIENFGKSSYEKIHNEFYFENNKSNYPWENKKNQIKLF